MTRERAIELLKDFQFCCDLDDCTNAWDCDECAEALNMAIEVLERQTCDHCKYSEETDGMTCYECVKGISDNFEALEQERQEDIYECPNCLGEVHKNYIYCPFCGERMESDTE